MVLAALFLTCSLSGTSATSPPILPLPDPAPFPRTSAGYRRSPEFTALRTVQQRGMEERRSLCSLPAELCAVCAHVDSTLAFLLRGRSWGYDRWPRADINPTASGNVSFLLVEGKMEPTGRPGVREVLVGGRGCSDPRDGERLRNRSVTSQKKSLE